MGVHVSRNLLLVGLACLILGLVLGAGGMAAFTRTQADPTRSTAQRWIDALTAKDTVRMASLYVADAEWRDAALGDDFHGSDVAKEGWDPVFAFSTVKDVRLMTSGDDGAAVAWTLTGDSGPMQHLPFSTPGVSVLEMHDGQIVRETVYYDPASLN